MAVKEVVCSLDQQSFWEVPEVVRTGKRLPVASTQCELLHPTSPTRESATCMWGLLDLYSMRLHRYHLRSLTGVRDGSDAGTSNLKTGDSWELGGGGSSKKGKGICPFLPTHLCYPGMTRKIYAWGPCSLQRSKVNPRLDPLPFSWKRMLGGDEQWNKNRFLFKIPDGGVHREMHSWENIGYSQGRGSTSVHIPAWNYESLHVKSRDAGNMCIQEPCAWTSNTYMHFSFVPSWFINGFPQPASVGFSTEVRVCC